MSDESNNSALAGEVVTKSEVSDKSKVAAALLCFFLGMLGIHRFYLGKIGTGAIMLILTAMGSFTVGIIVGIGPITFVGVWVMIDFIRILCSNLDDSQGRKLR